MKKKKTKNNHHPIIRYLLNHITLIISLLIPSTIYIVGYSYEYGYLAEFGIQSDIFPRGIEFYLIQGFYIIANVIFSSANYLRLLIYPVLLIVILYPFYNFYKVGLTQKQLTENQKIKKSKNHTYTNKDLLFDTTVFGGTILLIIFCIYVFSVIYYGAFNEISRYYGRDVAREIKQQYEKYQGCETEKKLKYNCGYFFDNHNPKAIITVQNDNILLWNGKTADLHKISNSSFSFNQPFKKESLKKTDKETKD